MLHVAKMYERNLERRTIVIVDNRLDEWQNSFWPGGLTIDFIFELKFLYEKNYEFDKRKYLSFVDLEKAFERVPRRILWKRTHTDLWT